MTGHRRDHGQMRAGPPGPHDRRNQGERSPPMSITRSRTTRRLAIAGVVFASLAPAAVAAAGDHERVDEPQLEGRAVLPVETYAKGPASGAALVGGSTDPDGNG